MNRPMWRQSAIRQAARSPRMFSASQIPASEPAVCYLWGQGAYIRCVARALGQTLGQTHEQTHEQKKGPCSFGSHPCWG